MSEELRHVSVWKIWANPIFLRFVRSRLRPAPLATWIALILTVVAFLYFFTYLSPNTASAPRPRQRPGMRSSRSFSCRCSSFC